MKVKAQAERAGELLPADRLHPAVLAWAARRKKTEPWAVAFSGGADSTALLVLLRAHFPSHPLVALHFNHRLRGRQSTADENFCRRVCTGLGVRLRVGRWRTSRPGASEAESRQARHDFFRRAMEQGGLCVLWLAHQQDDIAESMLMRLARGSGTAGLAAPRPVQVIDRRWTHLRPLLTLKKTELTGALKKAGLAWREDASNAGDDHFRNRVRQRVLPAWAKAAGRDAVAGAALARERLEEDDRALDLWVEKLALIDRARRLNVQALAGLPRAVTRRALHRWLLVVGPRTDLSRQGFEILLTAVERGQSTRFSLGRNGFAVIRQGRLGFRKT